MQRRLSIPWINQLFKRFHAIYGDRWIKNFDNDPELLEKSKDEWSLALGDMSADEIKLALDTCRMHLEWPPVPSQFRKLGKNVISEDDALQAAVRRNFENPIVRKVFDKVGSWDMSHLDDKTLRKKWSSAYKETIEKHDYLKIDFKSATSSDKIKALPSIQIVV